MSEAMQSIHPAWLRATHWLNAIAVVILAMSGWRIYNAAPFFGFNIANAITLGGWLGGAIQWHFAAMWRKHAAIPRCLYGSSFLVERQQ